MIGNWVDRIGCRIVRPSQCVHKWNNGVQRRQRSPITELFSKRVFLIVRPFHKLLGRSKRVNATPVALNIFATLWKLMTVKLVGNQATTSIARPPPNEWPVNERALDLFGRFADMA